MILALSARFNCIFNFFDLIFKPGLDKGNLWPSSSVKNKINECVNCTLCAESIVNEFNDSWLFFCLMFDHRPSTIDR